MKNLDFHSEREEKYPVNKSEAEWREELGEKRYHILREKGTEYPNTGAYNLHFENGTYACAACHQPLFNSDSKFESSCGWPSFDDALDGAVEYVQDTSHGMIRTEILCANCGSHLGHVFEDGPTETGQRFCINSLSMDFKKK
ncbi:MAG TPA: peptide-methionine (R)-S-oxide reductase MsrB [Aequorivita sp.]|nr:peptide-methionine (R)-S-oxide reductase MsrB [Aequorivita sp.]